MNKTSYLIIAALALFPAGRATLAADPAVDLSNATLLVPPGITGPERAAARMLMQETQKRSQVAWPVVEAGPDHSLKVLAGTATSSSENGPLGFKPVVVLGQRAALLKAFPSLADKLGTGAADGKPEGYHIVTAPDLVIVAGNDERGVVYGAGRLLRIMEYTGETPPDHLGTVRVASGWNLSTAPVYALRGHQLGYRPKTNAYVGWTQAMWEQYIRDLVIFGDNAIEGIPPRSDDLFDSPHFTMPPQQGLEAQSKIAAEYGIQFWVWYPAQERDYSNQQTIDSELKAWEEVLKPLVRLDAVFVPGGDPGHTEPGVMFAYLDKVNAMLQRIHPGCQLWMSPQGFDGKWMDTFFTLMKAEPAWLTGICFGPQQRVSADELRAKVPKRYKMRFYPDITHSVESQYPVPDWDYAYPVTENREVANPRPVDEAAIFHRIQPLCEYGFLTYSEGCNDDVNKCVWSSLGWDPNESLIDILRDYSHFYIGGGSLAEGFAQGLMAEERNWRGPLLANEGVNTTLAQFQDMERTVSPMVLENWRFQQALYRAYYDALDRTRLIAETAQEEKAMDELRRAPYIGSAAAMGAAEHALVPPEVMPGAALRARVFELAEALFNSIHAKLSVDRYKAEAIGRGANLDLIDTPLNNAEWLRAQFEKVRALGTESERLAKIDGILHWSDPGPGGWYDNLGDVAWHPHLVPGLPYAEDPAFLKGPFIGVSGGPRSEPQMATPPRGGFGGGGGGRGGAGAGGGGAAPAAGQGAQAAQGGRGGGGGFAGFQALASMGPRRISSARFSETLHETPLEMQYHNLDKTIHYKLRVMYGTGSFRTPIRLVANGTYEVHPLEQNPMQADPIEYDLPQNVTAGGELHLTFSGPEGLGGDGRGVQVAEVWLEPVRPAPDMGQRGRRGGGG